MLKIIGCGGHARSAADIYLETSDGEVITFYDDNARADEMILGSLVKKTSQINIVSGDKMHIAIGDNKKREKIFSLYKSKQVLFPNIISKYAYVSETAKLGEAILIGDFCHIGPEVVIGNNTIINNGAIVEHEVNIGKNCHIAPRSVISGRSIIGDNVFLGVGSVVKDSITIGSDITIGAGAVVVSNLTETGTYVGVPARKIE